MASRPALEMEEAVTAAQMLLCDTREPNPHPWAKYLPEGWRIGRGTLETGDLALAGLPEGAVIERKASSDMAGCIDRDRERFTRELRRGRYVGRLVVVVEGTTSDVAAAARGIHHNAVVGTLASWTLRFCPFIFAGSERLAADFAFRFLAGQVRSIDCVANVVRKACAALKPAQDDNYIPF